MLMNGIILAAGRGSRMLDARTDDPKCMNRIGHKTILWRQLDAFEMAGIRKIAIVVGYNKERIMEHVADINFDKRFDIHYVINEDWKNTNNMYSLYIASQYLKEGAIFTNGDNYFEPTLLLRLVNSEFDNCVLVDNSGNIDEESMKVRSTVDKFKNFSKDMPLEEAVGEFCGIAKVSPSGGKELAKAMECWILAHGKKDWFEMAMDKLEWDIVTTDGAVFVEIDFVKDLDRAIALYINSAFPVI